MKHIKTKELEEFVKDHTEFAEKVRAYFRSLPLMPQLARKALKRNLCNAHGYIFLEDQKLYIKVEKAEKFKKIIGNYISKTQPNDEQI